MSKYTELITNYHATKPKFLAHVDLMTRPLIDVAAATRGLITAFDIDSAVGVQLDILGLWIGRNGGVPSTGDINIIGGCGGDGQSGNIGVSGEGGTSYWGGGGRAGAGGGVSGKAYGSGGGGAYDAGYSGTSMTGGKGAAGICIIEEFA